MNIAANGLCVWRGGGPGCVIPQWAEQKNIRFISYHLKENTILGNASVDRWNKSSNREQYAKRSSAYLIWRYQVSRGGRKIICLPVLTISSFNRRKKDAILTCFDDIKFLEEKERCNAYLFWRYQVSRGERKIICLPVLTISSFNRRKKDDLLTCFDDISVFCQPLRYH